MLPKSSDLFQKNQEKNQEKKKEKRSKKQEKEKRSKKSEKRHDSTTKKRTKKHKSESEPIRDTNEAKQLSKKIGISGGSIGSNASVETNVLNGSHEIKTGSETKPTTKYKKLRFFNFIGSPKSNSKLS